MLKKVLVKRTGSEKDQVILTFECNGNLDNNYDGFLEDATQAIVHLLKNYGREPGKFLRPRLISLLDGYFSSYRD